mmetsp:Transcript_10764/g.25900  ORF Transcript_10764/g.25900 Transcript_10764/m.25900 type:complete len:262 (+) Transcript_10764:77-862(+)
MFGNRTNGIAAAVVLVDFLEGSSKESHVGSSFAAVETLLFLEIIWIGICFQRIAPNRRLAFRFDGIFVGGIAFPRNQVQTLSRVRGCFVAFQCLLHLLVRHVFGNAVAQSCRRLLQKCLLQGLQSVRSVAGSPGQINGDLVVRVIGTRSDTILENAAVVLDIAGTELNAQRDTLSFPLKVFRTVAEVVSVVNLNLQALALEAFDQLVQSFVHSGLTLDIVLLGFNRDHHHLDGCYARGQDQPGIIRVRHDQGTQQTRGNTP